MYLSLLGLSLRIEIIITFYIIHSYMTQKSLNACKTSNSDINRRKTRANRSSIWPLWILASKAHESALLIMISKDTVQSEWKGKRWKKVWIGIENCRPQLTLFEIVTQMPHAISRLLKSASLRQFLDLLVCHTKLLMDKNLIFQVGIVLSSLETHRIAEKGYSAFSTNMGCFVGLGYKLPNAWQP